MPDRTYTTDLLLGHARRGGEWLAGPATRQDRGAMFGAIQGNYDCLEKTWKTYEPFWHTGQAVRAWLALYQVTGEEQWLDYARRGGDFMVGQQIVDPSNPGRHGAIRTADDRSDPSRADNVVVTTTITNGLEGLFDLAAVTQDAAYADCARQAIDWLHHNAEDPATGFLWLTLDVKASDDDRAKPLKLRRYRHSGSEDEDVVWQRPDAEGATFWYAARWFGRNEDAQSFKKVCDFLVDDQDPDTGVWLDWKCNEPRKDGTHKIHCRYNLWLAFALLFAEETFGGGRYRRAAEGVARFYRGAQSPDGVLTQNIRSDGRLFCLQPLSSSSAMSSLLWLKLMRDGFDKDYAHGLLLTLHFILRNQFPPDWHDPALRGAFYEAWGQRLATGLQRDVGTVWSVQLLGRLLLGLREMGYGSVEEWIEAAAPFAWTPWPGEKSERKG